MIIYAHTITARLRYITSFIGNQIRDNDFFQLTDNLITYRDSRDFRINYSTARITEPELQIFPHPLLFEEDIRQQRIDCFTINNYKAFFKTGGDFPFDIFAASFYLLSRYEEWLPHEKDSYGRYAHENSLAFRENFLHLPLVNLWIRELKEQLIKTFPGLTIYQPIPGGYHDGDRQSPAHFMPTYDIDEAWCYRHKPILKNAAAMLLSLFKGEWKAVAERIKTLTGKQQDPYDAYAWMDQLHTKYKLRPSYFFIVADKKSKYDKNISPGKAALQNLVGQIKQNYPVGIHPSWQSGDEVALITSEKKGWNK